MSTVIDVDNVTKIYHLGEIGSGTLGGDIKRISARILGREDPLKKINATHRDKDIHVALQDVSFSVKDGEVLGLIGKNGAGKSTMLKILSRITAPTKGTVKMKGRVASLLEVGTGFHPDLTGRDNIYLNGAILGMLRSEVKAKFDEIVDFSGVAKFIDTPVKRYSSGMYVRLAFAVAAHLEPEILIIDEVLAVGDGEFQKKCLGKMKDISSRDGRTVLFVSHNMTAIKNLCTRAIFLKHGQLVKSGPASEIVSDYLNHEFKDCLEQYWEYSYAPGNEWVRVKGIKLIPKLNGSDTTITPSTPIDLEFEFWNEVDDMSLNLSLQLFNASGDMVFNVLSPVVNLTKGLHKGICYIPSNLLNDGHYSIAMMIVKEKSTSLYNLENAVTFEVIENREATGWHDKWPGYVRPHLEFELE